MTLKKFLAWYTILLCFTVQQAVIFVIPAASPPQGHALTPSPPATRSRDGPVHQASNNFKNNAVDFIALVVASIGVSMLGMVAYSLLQEVTSRNR